MTMSILAVQRRSSSPHTTPVSYSLQWKLKPDNMADLTGSGPENWRLLPCPRAFKTFTERRNQSTLEIDAHTS